MTNGWNLKLGGIFLENPWNPWLEFPVECVSHRFTAEMFGCIVNYASKSLFDFNSGNLSKWQALLSLEKNNYSNIKTLNVSWNAMCVCVSHFGQTVGITFGGLPPLVEEVQRFIGPGLTLKAMKVCLKRKMFSKVAFSYPRIHLTSLMSCLKPLKQWFFRRKVVIFENRGDMSPRECTSSKPSCITVGYMFMCFF